MRLWRERRSAVATVDGRALRRGRYRALVLRASFAAAAIALLLAAAASARGLDVRERSFLPPGSTGVVVLDLSLSIAETNYIDVRRAVKELVDTDAPIGLVVFSDVPYELMPPGTPASELSPMLRLLRPPSVGNPVNPWTQSFRAGTRISSALDLARTMLLRDHVRNGYIVLVSDLETAPDDVQAMTQMVSELRRKSIDLRVVPIAASTDGVRIYEQLLGKQGFGKLRGGNGESRVFDSVLSGGLPTVLLLLGGLLFLVLALHERFAGRLALPRGGRARW
jgi:hypothetical protein